MYLEKDMLYRSLIQIKTMKLGRFGLMIVLAILADMLLKKLKRILNDTFKCVIMVASKNVNNAAATNRQSISAQAQTAGRPPFLRIWLTLMTGCGLITARDLAAL